MLTFRRVAEMPSRLNVQDLVLQDRGHNDPYWTVTWENV